jgi:hypothetical protein
MARDDAAGPRPLAAYVAAFIGFAHLLNRTVFLDWAVTAKSFVFYGEEKTTVCGCSIADTEWCTCRMRWWCTHRMRPAERRSAICDT